MKSYLVTGGFGFIGSSLVRRLVKRGHRVRVLDDMSRGAGRRLADVRADIEAIDGDVRDAAKVIEAARGMNSILHLAAINGTEFFYQKPMEVLDVAVRGMLAVIDACRHHDIGELVLASSSEVYQSAPLVPTPEDVPLIVPDIKNPRYSYGGGKIASELIAMNYGRTGFERVLIFRPHNVYGADMGWEHVIPQLSLRAATAVRETPQGAVPFPIHGDGRQTRAFVHIDDFTDGIECVLEKGRHLEIYHVGNDEEVTIADLSARIVACFDREVRIQPGAAVAGETSRRCPDITKLRSLGFRPTTSLSKGLPDVVGWYASNAHLKPQPT